MVPKLPTLPLVFLTLTDPFTSPLRLDGELRSLDIGISPFPLPELRAGVFGLPVMRFSTSLSAPALAREVLHSFVFVIVVVLVQETARRLSDVTGEREARRASIRSWNSSSDSESPLTCREIDTISVSGRIKGSFSVLRWREEAP
jgi:hypothetical protein